MGLNIQNLQQLATGLPEEVLKQLGAVLRAQDKMNADIAQAFAAMQPTAWQTPQLLNGWVNLSSERYAQYRRFAISSLTLVLGEGTIASGTVGQVAYYLPVGWRPVQRISTATSSNGAFGNLIVEPDGGVLPNVGSNVNFNVNFLFAAAEA